MFMKEILNSGGGTFLRIIFFWTVRIIVKLCLVVYIDMTEKKNMEISNSVILAANIVHLSRDM